MKEAVTCWIQKETHNRLKVFCALHRLSMMQVVTQAVEEWLEQHGSNLGDEALQAVLPGFFYSLKKINNLQNRQNITKPTYIVVYKSITTIYRNQYIKTGNYR
jgi:hypothetical protein